MLIIVALLALKIAVVLIVAGLVARALRGASAARRHLTWTVGLVGVLALPIGSLLVPAWRIPVPAALQVSRASSPAESKQVNAVPAPSRESGSRGMVSSEMSRSTVARVAPSTSPRMSSRRAVAALAPWWGALALMAWSLGSLVALARLVRDLSLARALVRRCRVSESQSQLDALASEIDCGSRPRLLESDEVSVPMTFGARRAAILVPTGFAAWDFPRRREVLLHELAHVARHDWSASLMARFAKAVFWFHPLVHLAERRLRVEAEQAADDLVLTHGTRASSYAAHLLGFARATHPASRSTVMTLSIVGGPLDQRIHAVLDAKRVRGPVSVAGRVAFAAGALTLVLACSAVEVRAEPAPNGAWDHLAMAFDGIFGTSHGGHGWSSRAMDLHENGKHAEAIECWQKAIAEGHSAGFEAMRARRGEDESSVEARNRRFAASPTSGNAAYNVACALALDGRTAEALQALERSVEIGYSDADHAADDSDLASLRSDAKFQELLEQMRAVELPSRFSLFGHEMGVNEAEWKDARDRHQGYVARHPKSGHAWSNLGYIHLGLDAPDAALSAYEHAQALGYAPGQTAYNLACCHARAGQVDAAFASLERAAAAGFDMGNYLASDDDLDSLRDDARFAKFQRAHPSTMRGLHDRIRGHVTRAIAL